MPRAAVEPLILMLSPIAPHICEELWSKLGHTESLAHADWPKADERYVGQDSDHRGHRDRSDKDT